MEKFRYDEDEGAFNIYCPELKEAKDFEKVVNNTIAAIKEFQAGNGYGHFISLRFVNESEEEIEFWDALCKKPKAFPAAEKYLKQCIKIVKKDPYNTWEADEIPLAGKTAYQLAMADKRFIPYYSELLGHWDMDHEVYQGGHINEMIDKYGWCQEVESLLIARASVGAGQHGTQQIRDNEEFIRAHNSPLVESAFFQKLVKQMLKFWREFWDEDEDENREIKDVLGSMAEEAIELRDKHKL